MTHIRIGIVQQANSASKDDNRTRLSRSIRLLAEQGADLVVLEELHDTLYFCQTEDTRNFDLAVIVPQSPDIEYYRKLAGELRVVIVGSFFEKRAPGLYHNTAVVFDSDGTVAGIYRKMHIPDDPGFYEKFYFAPGDCGFRPIRTRIGILGVMVCWDQWFPEAARLMALAGAQILIYPTAIGFDPRDAADERQRQLQAWQTVQRGHAVANGLPVVTANRVGHEADPSGSTAGIDFWGSSFVAGPQGELLLQAPSNQPCTESVSVDLERSCAVRRIWPFFRDRRIDSYRNLTRRFDD